MLPPALTKFATYMLRKRGIVLFNVGSRAVACKEGACIQRRPARRLPVLDSALASAGKRAHWRLSAGVNAVQYRLVIWIGCRAGREPDEKLQRSAKFDLRIAAGPRPNSRVNSRHLAGIPTKRAIRRLDDALVATLLTFCPLSLTSIHGSNPQDAVLWGHHF
jgi:hypothetical protein